MTWRSGRRCTAATRPVARAPCPARRGSLRVLRTISKASIDRVRPTAPACSRPGAVSAGRGTGCPPVDHRREPAVRFSPARRDGDLVLERKGKQLAGHGRALPGRPVAGADAAPACRAAPRRSSERRRLDQFLEPLDLRADGGLGPAHRLAGRGGTAEFRHRGEGPQQVHPHGSHAPRHFPDRGRHAAR